MSAGRAALVLSVLALVAAVAGVAGALPGRNSVRSDDIRRNAVKASDIRKGAVRAAEIRQGAVDSSEIRDKAVRGEDLSDAVALEVLPTRRVTMTKGHFDITFLEAPPLDLLARCADNGGAPSAQVFVRTSAEGSAYGPSATPNFGPNTPLEPNRLLISNTSTSPSMETTPFTMAGPDGPTVSGVVGAGNLVQGRDCVFTGYAVQGTASLQSTGLFGR